MTSSEKKEQKISNRQYRRHKFIWGIAHQTLKPYLRLAVNLKRKKSPKLQRPFIVLSNHVTNLDPVILASCIRKQCYFVASEQFYRSGFKSKILYWAFQPISKIKGSSDKLTVMKAIRCLREGKNVAIFPEGNRTFTGESGKANVATGKLIKVSAASLVTFRIDGGYLTFPRWGFGKRKGKMSAGIVNVYPAEMLKTLSPEEITDLVNKDIYVDAYAMQDKEPVKHKGKNLAYGMECAMGVCPECEKIGTMATDKNSIFCKNCGAKATLDEYGFFNKEFKFRSVLEWDRWQEEYYKKYVKNFADPLQPLFKDTNVSIQTVTDDHQTKSLGYGTFSMYLDRFIFEPLDKEEIVFEIAKVPDTSVYGKSIFCFSDSDGIHYELHADKIINVRKYLSCWTFLREMMPKE